MTKEEKEELEKKITETQAELELWKKYRELKDELDKLKKEPQPTIITYPIYIPTYPTCPTWPSYPSYPSYPHWGTYVGSNVYCVSDNDNTGRTISGG